MKKAMQERIAAELRKRFTENGWKTITITMKSDGAKISIRPLEAQGLDKVTCEADADWYFVTGSRALYDENSIDRIAKQLAEYDKLVAEYADEKMKLKAFWDKHVGNWDAESWGWYSDWHKDVYGMRPGSQEVFGMTRHGFCVA